MDPVTIDYADEAKGLLAQQYKEKPNFAGMIDAVATPIQEIDGVLRQISTLDDITVATGVNLDVDGEIVGQTRDLVAGEIPDDAQYRLFIQARELRNVSHSYGEDMIAAIVKIFSTVVIYQDFGGMAIGVAIGVQPSAIQLALLADDILPRAMGVRLSTAWFDSTNYFGFYEDANAKGFGEIGDPTQGGKFAEIF